MSEKRARSQAARDISSEGSSLDLDTLEPDDIPNLSIEQLRQILTAEGL
jgi:hypothetical protein